MKIDISFVYALLFLWFGHGFLYAQDDTNEDLSTQEVLVVKSYTPSLSDAFKITEGPKIPDSSKATNKTESISPRKNY